ncbi:MAG: HD domain-containing protein [Candidatus Woesearchaeota archaeon]
MKEINFFQKVMKLKETKRTGWTRYKKIAHPESVADHSFGVSLLALIVPLPKGIDRDKLIKMAIVHEVGEAEIGDVVWERGNKTDKPKKDTKHISETKAINLLFNDLDKDNLKELALEFGEQKTKIAKFLKELDKLETVLQAFEYEKITDPRDLEEFWENARKYIQDPKLKEYFDKLFEQRTK